jgi:succinoglycan biosynthesis transport protein ExoP
MEEIEKTLVEKINAFLDIVKRHKFYLLIPFITISIISSIIAMKLPLTYLSKGTILIEEQQIPQSMIPTTVTGFADERIGFIQQRVMTRERILSIVDKYRLYPKQQDQLTPSELVKRFQSSVSINMIAADAGSGGGKVTIAFTISFSAQKPATALAIASELVNLFMAENSRVRTQRAAKTTEFLSEEAERVNREVQDMENKIAEFKEKFGRSLPELLPTNLTAVERVTGDLRQTENQINLLKERIAYLTASLPLVRQEAPVPQYRDGQRPLSKEEQVRVLKAEYMRLSSRYKPSHPDIVRVERQIKALDPDFKGTLDRQDVALELERTDQELDALEEIYDENHPDVVKLKQKAKKLEQQSASNPAASRPVFDVSAGSSDPIYINLLGQFNSSQTELNGLEKRQAELQRDLEQLNNIIAQTPKVERGYNELVRERETSLAKFSELKSKVQEAKLAQELEEGQKGESFSLIEPPVLPDKPEKGTQTKFLLTGVATGLLVGFGLTVLAESLDSSVRGHRALQAITGIPPIIVIPYIENDDDVELHRRRIKLMWVGGLVFLVIIILFIHFFVMPLDDIWDKLALSL